MPIQYGGGNPVVKKALNTVRDRPNPRQVTSLTQSIAPLLQTLQGQRGVAPLMRAASPEMFAMRWGGAGQGVPAAREADEDSWVRQFLGGAAGALDPRNIGLSSFVASPPWTGRGEKEQKQFGGMVDALMAGEPGALGGASTMFLPIPFLKGAPRTAGRVTGYPSGRRQIPFPTPLSKRRLQGKNVGFGDRRGRMVRERDSVDIPTHLANLPPTLRQGMTRPGRPDKQPDYGEYGNRDFADTYDPRVMEESPFGWPDDPDYFNFHSDPRYRATAPQNVRQQLPWLGDYKIPVSKRVGERGGTTNPNFTPQQLQEVMRRMFL